MGKKARGREGSFEGKHEGFAWSMGDDVSTDDIIPGKFLEIRDIATLSTHVFDRFGLEFATKVKHGDAIIAGKNFGCGSSREQAPALLKFLGVGAIFACSFARIFYRNAINVGLPAIVIDTDTWNGLKSPKDITYTLDPPMLTRLDTGRSFKLQPLPAFFLEILRAGGAIPLLKKERESR
jgi:3-isopropylmalate dehydratase small subunit